MSRTLHGKLSLVLLLFTTRVHNEEVSQHFNRDLASHLACHLR